MAKRRVSILESLFSYAKVGTLVLRRSKASLRLNILRRSLIFAARLCCTVATRLRFLDGLFDFLKSKLSRKIRKLCQRNFFVTYFLEYLVLPELEDEATGFPPPLVPLFIEVVEAAAAAAAAAEVQNSWPAERPEIKDSCW